MLRRPTASPSPTVGKPRSSSAFRSLSAMFKPIEHVAVPPRRETGKPRPRVMNRPTLSTPRKGHPAVVVPAAAPAETPLGEATLTEIPKVEARPRLLVVDDDAAIRDLLTRILSRTGFDADVAKDGGEAILKIGAVGKPGYALILLDLMMPIISGFEVIDYFKIHDPSMLARIVVITASPKVDRSKISREMIGGLIEKPFDIAHFVALVKPMIEANTPH